ncbi:hypothetical protein IVB34_47640 [Bradyrhizobium sp. 2]|uniref:hypothetical protein n=1 Tax=unclassified Bradyrhizobium TaxID=2631580 RepID=UPI001FF7EF89|nr:MULTISPECIES: hypothetical protein [unclassified Bradyrhizobium]MCK1465763.1 hypothetical protein [Bradyrhizobium sp. 2]MCK1520214.1 hypothetical protein [Bradyrhizobium sp. 17]
MTTKMDRTTAGLRNILLDEIDSLRAGETKQDRAHAIARLANAAIATVRLEMDAQEMERVEPKALVSLKPLALVA